MFMLVGVWRKGKLEVSSERFLREDFRFGTLTPGGIFHPLYMVEAFSLTRGNLLLAGDDTLRRVRDDYTIQSMYSP